MELDTPYYAVIFSNTRTDGDDGYLAMAKYMEELAQQQSGFMGIESVRDGLGITISYWESLQAIADWKANMEHKVAQEKGISNWYSWYKVRICKVEREYEFSKK